MHRQQEIIDALDGSPICWFGTRGLDAAPLAAVGRLALVSSQIAPMEESASAGVEQDCLELRVGKRYDLDRYDIDLDPSLKAKGLKTRFVANARPPMTIVAYRPTDFLTAVAFCETQINCAFNLHVFQRQFEHKPWVEKSVSKAAPHLNMLPISFVRDTDHEVVRGLTSRGPMVGRTSTGSGGNGVFLFSSEQEFTERLPEHRDGFVGISPFFEQATPLNVNACVYADGKTVGFAASYQLIGIHGLTTRRFGFCGNDFGAASELGDRALAEIEKAVQGVGAWLARLGYLGIFGLDMLLQQDKLFITELNPRFQASTPLGAAIAQALGEPDPMTEHLAAFLRLPSLEGVDVPSQTRSIKKLVGRVPVAQVIHRNTLVDPVCLDAAPRPSEGTRIEGRAPQHLPVASDAMLFRSMHNRSVTKTGYCLDADVTAMSRAARIGF